MNRCDNCGQWSIDHCGNMFLLHFDIFAQAPGYYALCKHAFFTVNQIGFETHIKRMNAAGKCFHTLFMSRRVGTNAELQAGIGDFERAKTAMSTDNYIALVHVRRHLSATSIFEKV